jgi:hypothetical protein
MTDNDNIALAIQTLLDNNKPITAASVSDLTGIRTQYVYKFPSFRPFVLTRKKKISKSGPVTSYTAAELKESIQQTEEGYRNYLIDSYFFHAETVADVKQDMLTAIHSFDGNIFNNAVMTLIRTGELIEAKPRNKDDIARYVWSESQGTQIDAPVEPVAPPTLKAIVDEWKANAEDMFYIGSQSEGIKALYESGKVHMSEKEPISLVPNPPQIVVSEKPKTISYKRGWRKDRVKEATAELLHRIAEYVTDTGEDDPEILKLEEFARAALKRIQKVA